MNNFLRGFFTAAFVILCFALVGGIGFAITAGIVKLICWAFGFTFSWKIAFGFWLILLLLGGFNVKIKCTTE